MVMIKITLLTKNTLLGLCTIRIRLLKNNSQILLNYFWRVFHAKPDNSVK
jgi:hypothetical protein